LRATTALTTLLCLLALAGLPAAASASSGQLALLQDDRELLLRGASVRDATLDEARALGVDAIKFELPWSAVAPKGKSKPNGFDGSNPAAYGSGWDAYAALVSAAQARGFRVMIAIGPPVPGWATARRGDRVGVDRPSASEFGRFAEAAGRRFPGVDLWALWNEPNHPRFLFPQATAGRIPRAPHLYRALVRAAADGLAASGHAGNTILFGELLPIGKSRLFRKNTMKPLLFLREFFCLDSHWRRFTGRAARARGCSRYRPVSGVNGFAYHPYTRPNGPRGREPTRDDATIRSIPRITRALDLARRSGRIRGGKLSVWDTEFGFQSNPPDPFQTRLSRIPAFLAESEWISYRNPRVASYSQYTMVDTPVGNRGDLFGTWQGGLRFASGRQKPGVYESFRLPLFVRLLGPGAVEVWGDARPGGGGSVVQVQQRQGRGSFSDLGGPFAVSNARGYFRVRFRIAQAAKRSFRFVSQGLTSRTARPVVR
jgi:hypothetical protein